MESVGDIGINIRVQTPNIMATPTMVRDNGVTRERRLGWANLLDPCPNTAEVAFASHLQVGDDHAGRGGKSHLVVMGAKKLDRVAKNAAPAG